jgi:hypothetical protein
MGSGTDMTFHRICPSISHKYRRYSNDVGDIPRNILCPVLKFFRFPPAMQMFRNYKDSSTAVTTAVILRLNISVEVRPCQREMALTGEVDK